MSVFLTDEWFSKVDQLAAVAGDFNLPESLANLAINMKVSDVGNGLDMSLEGGKIAKGFSDNAKVTVTLDSKTLRQVFFELDTAAAMSAFMSGQLKVEGDMMQLMTLQMVQPSDAYKAFLTQVLEQTT